MELSFLDIQLLREHFPGADDFDAAKAKVEAGQPLAYVLGEWYFYGLSFSLNADCLIPRPDTEHLVDYLIENLPMGGIFADLCTGSGCIAISVLEKRKDLRGIAVDLSEGALEMARINAERNGVADRLTILQSNVLRGEGIAHGILLDAIVSNPPYIRSDVIPTLETVQREPILALDGGADGLDFYRAIPANYRRYLKENGFFVFEIGFDQAQDLRAMYDCEIFKDYGGNDRVAVFGKSKGEEK